eukprot:3826240-Karenia_brevis.AAC.1
MLSRIQDYAGHAAPAFSEGAITNMVAFDGKVCDIFDDDAAAVDFTMGPPVLEPCDQLQRGHLSYDFEGHATPVLKKHLIPTTADTPRDQLQRRH